MQHDLHTLPVSSDPAEVRRIEEVRRRIRLLEGTWDEDLERRLDLQFGPEVRGVKGPRTKAKNLFRSVPEQLAVLYNEVPDAWHEQAEQTAPLIGPDGLLQRAGLWPLMRHVQTYALGCRESLVRVSWNERRGSLAYRHVTADRVMANAPPDDPGHPWMVQELRWYDVGELGGRWCWEVFDISDPAAPVYAIHIVDTSGDRAWDRGEDVTAIVAGEMADPYPWRFADGEPFIPYALYHAEQPTRLWDTWKWCELVDGAYDLAVAATHFQHLLFRGSWSQKWAVGALVAGTRSKGDEAHSRRAVPMDPTGLLHLEADTEPGQSPQIGEWGPPTNLVEYIQALEAYERMISNVAGIDGSHIMRESADAWSGAALTISRDGKREAQRVYGPQFQPVDEHLLAMSAAVVNIATGSNLPEAGYRVQHRSLPLSGAELRDLREHHNEMIAQGRMSSVDAYQAEHPGMTRKEAMLELARIAREEAALEQMRRALAPEQPTAPDPPNGEPADDDEADDESDDSEERAA